jgi:hypothetical protein
VKYRYRNLIKVIRNKKETKNMSDNLSKNATNSTNSKDEVNKISIPHTTGGKVVEEGGGLPLMQVRIQNLHCHAYK